MIVPGDVDDHKSFVKFIYGELVGDKGYIGRHLFERFFVDGIRLLAKLKKNMNGASCNGADIN